MEKSWAGSDGDTQMAEMRALRYGAFLAYDCNRATAQTDEGREVKILIMYHHDPAAKYEAGSAITTLASYHDRLAPYFTALGKLPMPSEVTLDSMCQQFLVHEPDLAKAWHNWLWPRGLSENDHGEASLFAIAASRLSSSMEAIIGPTSNR
jgi:hypothetical protein